MAAPQAKYLLVTLVAACVLLLGVPCAEARIVKSKEDYVEFEYYLHFFQATPEANSGVIVPPLAGFENLFGAVVVFDTLLTTGPELDSTAVGRAKGFFVFDNDDASNPGEGAELVFTSLFDQASGYGAGTTLSYRGHDFGPVDVVEVSLSGGTGKFRLARGWAFRTNVIVNSTYTLLKVSNFVYLN